MAFIRQSNEKMRQKMLHFGMEKTMDNDNITHALEMVDLSKFTPNMLYETAKDIMEQLVDFKEIRMMYSCAIKEIRTKFEVLDTEFNSRYQRNPISSITSRLKSNKSILGKLSRKGLDFSIENIENNIHDIAGVRVVCSYVDDIYVLADALISQNDITLIKRKDYITNPKPNGYRSLHLIVSVPVFFAEQTKQMQVEVQIRTIAMDYWASLEHQLKYKKDVPEEADVIERLKNCADTIANLDKEMIDIRNQLALGTDDKTEDDVLFEKMKRLNISFD